MTEFNKEIWEVEENERNLWTSEIGDGRDVIYEIRDGYGEYTYNCECEYIENYNDTEEYEMWKEDLLRKCY